MSKTFNVVIWDAVGNITWGMRGWDEYPESMKKQFLHEDPHGRARIQNIAEFLAPHEVIVTHVKSVEELEGVIAGADFLIAHKVMVPGSIMRKGRNLKLVQHLGLDYRGIPLDAVGELNIPLAVTPMVMTI